MTNLITEYVGSGLLSARPPTPSVAAGCLALYYGTDTAVLYAWDGSAWQVTSAPTGGPQVKHFQTLTTVNTTAGFTLANTPTAGNLIVLSARVSGAVTPNTAAGWGKIDFAGTTTVGVFVRRVVGGDTTAIVPFTGTARAGAVTIYEIENAAAVGFLERNGGNTGSGTALVRSYSFFPSGLVLGAGFRSGATIPTLSGSGILDGTIYDAGAGGTVASYHVVSASGAVHNTTLTYGTSVTNYYSEILIV